MGPQEAVLNGSPFLFSVSKSLNSSRRPLKSLNAGLIDLETDYSFLFLFSLTTITDALHWY